MIKVYCYGIFADTMTDEEFYEVEKNQRECHAAWAENFSAVSELLEMNPVIDNLSIDLSKCPNIHCSGSVRGMKQCGFWPKNADVVRHGNYIYCIDT